ASGTLPTPNIECPTRRNFVDGNAAGLERHSFCTHLWFLSQVNEVDSRARADDRHGTVSLQKRNRLFIDADAAHVVRQFVLHYSSHKSKQSAEAVTRGKMRVGNCATQEIDLEEVVCDRHSFVVRIQ